ncbi:cytochrome o ubiquinol oxidase subunit IV [Undibacterium oligocarboniphilum]|uniref:Cytochrome bo(3) ubiquinol oxidase subunit 4 n=1 Tax=Undibacterium oligocarboniphilum TaxID=666702 RepID=A0A850QJE3_9BURK|nr:cytochrome o ubiquinol oxidase subunit IV [Undibacterium oligocarboniphilum]MBC3868900.1 cytochrome o ubiquinol oxidase subunit IV [Undibacterium oligocarboniphilum]NVO76880.1 cytochrome o ubiquinol oxidase subunit IV [Undibacterium oligocarboniphilum]
MSAHHEHLNHGDTHHDHHDHHGHGDHADHGSLKTYTIGFILSVFLTAVPFWLVMGKVIPDSRNLGFVLLFFAAIQIVVHMIYFLHMNSKAEGGWSMLALLFTCILVVIMLAGSLWVMYHLNHNMMPGMNHETVPESFNQPSTNEMNNMRNMP